MRSIEFANHQLQKASHFICGAGACDQRLVVCAHPGPIHSVIVLVIKEITQIRPSLPKHFHLFTRKIDIEFGGDVELASSAFEIHHTDTTILDVEDLFTVRRELYPTLVARSGSQLFRDGRLT